MDKMSGRPGTEVKVEVEVDVEDNFKSIRALCQTCGKPVFIRTTDGKLVCSVEGAGGWIPLSKRCFENTSSVLTA